MQTKPQTFIFIGRSGCGKGTQAKLLQEKLELHTPITPVFYLETGARFRDFIQTNTYSSALSKDIMERGALQPEFLAVWNWAHLFIENLKGDEHLILDGTPRKLDEAEVLDSAMTFYGRLNPIVIFLDVSKEFSMKRFVDRGRADDISIQAIEERMRWYDEHVVPAVRYYWQNPRYTLAHINGEQSIEDVHAEILKKIQFDILE
jgi:adenylate kinase family enzyme